MHENSSSKSSNPTPNVTAETWFLLSSFWSLLSPKRFKTEKRNLHVEVSSSSYLDKGNRQQITGTGVEKRIAGAGGCRASIEKQETGDVVLYCVCTLHVYFLNLRNFIVGIQRTFGQEVKYHFYCVPTYPTYVMCRSENKLDAQA